MSDHRIRLTDEDMDIVAAALRARLAMVRGARRGKLEALLDRFEERAVGNPLFRRSTVDQVVTAPAGSQ